MSEKISDRMEPEDRSNHGVGVRNAMRKIAESESKERELVRQKKAYFRDEGKKLGVHPKHIKEHENPYWDKKE